MINAERSQRAVAQAGDLARWLALGGVIGPILLVVAFTVAGTLRPGYSPIRQAISDLGVGPNGWLLDIALVANGALFIAFAAGFAISMREVLSPGWRWSSAVLLAVPGCGGAIAGIFTSAPATRTIHWLLGAYLFFIGAVVAFLVAGLALRRASRWRGWGTALLIACAVTVVVLAVMFWSFAPGTTVMSTRVNGLMERLGVIEIIAWYVALGLWLFSGAANKPVHQH